MGDIAPGHRVPFTLKVPYDDLGISGDPGVYRVGVKVVAGTSDGRNPDDAAYASTLMPLLPTGARADPRRPDRHPASAQRTGEAARRRRLRRRLAADAAVGRPGG